MIYLFSFLVCGPAKLSAVAGYTVVRWIPRLAPEALGSEAVDLHHNWTAFSCAVFGIPDSTQEQAGTVH